MISAEQKLIQLLRDDDVSNDDNVVVEGSDTVNFRKWFLQQFKAIGTDCSLEEFAVYFLSSLRQQAESHLRTNAVETVKCQTPARKQRLNRNKDEPQREVLSPQEGHGGQPEVSQSSQPFSNAGTPSTSRLSTSVDRFGCDSSTPQKGTSTPIRRNASNNNVRRTAATPPASNKFSSSSLCLGDFLVLGPSSSSNSSSSRSGKKKTPQTHSPSSLEKSNEKPKKRLVPTTISKHLVASPGRVFGGESAFSNENNILEISNSEVEDRNKCSILAARKSLKLNAFDISQELANTSSGRESLGPDGPVERCPPFELDRVTDRPVLQRLARIYALLIELNLTTNILNEIAFLLNILNCKDLSSHPELESANEGFHESKNEDTGLKALKDFTNCVYFAMQTLDYERSVLGLLDAKSLGVVVSCERFVYLDEDLKSYLHEIYQRKQHLDTQKGAQDTILHYDTKTYDNVYFQEEQDSLQHFSSYQEFSAFRAQRDLFYKALKFWESNHLNPSWRFSAEMPPRIREIFRQSENPVNMAHLAKLFVSQLLLSARNSTSPEEIGLDVDLQKFSKLAQRLVTPSSFSVDYQFPHSQAFFRDFIVEARSLAFAEQLKMELYSELINLNDSTFDQININASEEDDDECDGGVNANEYVVHADVLASMLILAKFLGFSTAQPFAQSNGGGALPARIEKEQIALRSLLQPNFDICRILEECLSRGKQLITIPWLVQYLAMLDNITLQLDNHMRTIRIMFVLYAYLGFEPSLSKICATSRFIVCSCLGWLFEKKQFIAEQYYAFRQNYDSVAKELPGDLPFVESWLEYASGGRLPAASGVGGPQHLNAILESTLVVACPFLAEFRVSIMPAKHSQKKNASRTGRYRYITTRIAELPAAHAHQDETDKVANVTNPTKPEAIQEQLLQAFLHSQNSSMRQLLNFCTERSYKCVVKDAQLKILLPSKSAADAQVNRIDSSDFQSVYNSVSSIYSNAQKEVLAQWNASVPQMLERRVRRALESLLPEETSSIVKHAYFAIVHREALRKIEIWCHANIVKDNFYCNDLQELASKLCNANRNKVEARLSELRIVKSTPSVSDLIDGLQFWLHCTSMRPDLFEGSAAVERYLRALPPAFENTLPVVLYRLMATGIIQLLQHIILRHTLSLTAEVIEAACRVWLHPNMQTALETAAAVRPQEGAEAESAVAVPKVPSIYEALITISFIESMGTRRLCYDRLSDLLITMVRKHVVSVSFVNELFVPIFKQDWNPLVLNEVSLMLRTIAQETAAFTKNNENYAADNDDEEDEKSNLFMEMLADLSRDVDLF